MASKRRCIASTPSMRPHESLRVSRGSHGSFATVSFPRRRQQAKLGMGSDGENDMIREMLLETKPWVLALTFIVSILHTVFEFLAFRNNVSDSVSVPEVF